MKSPVEIAAAIAAGSKVTSEEFVELHRASGGGLTYQHEAAKILLREGQRLITEHNTNAEISVN
jgi:hypothetical protein